MSKQPEALRLAAQLRDLSTLFKSPTYEKGVCNGASFELRRLHEVNQELMEALQRIKHHFDTDEYAWKIAEAAISKATGEQP
jgi:hypothetical protein